MKIAILGLGNSVLSDDAVGLKVAKRVKQLLPGFALPAGLECQVFCSEAGGWEVLDYAEGFDALILVDSILNHELGPGEMDWFPRGVFTSPRMSGVHSTDIFTALEFAARQGLKVPSVLHILGIGVEDIRTFSEECTPRVTAAIDPAAHAVLDRIIAL